MTKFSVFNCFESFFKTYHILDIVNKLDVLQTQLLLFLFLVTKAEKVLINLVKPCTKPQPSI